MLDNGHHVDPKTPEEAILEGDYQSLGPSEFEVNHPPKPFNLPYPQNYNYYNYNSYNYNNYNLFRPLHFGEIFYVAVNNQKITSSNNSFKPS